LRACADVDRVHANVGGRGDALLGQLDVIAAQRFVAWSEAPPAPIEKAR